MRLGRLQELDGRGDRELVPQLGDRRARAVEVRLARRALGLEPRDARGELAQRGRGARDVAREWRARLERERGALLLPS